MCDSHPNLAFLIRHHRPKQYLQLEPDERAKVERAFLDALHALTDADGSKSIDTLAALGPAELLNDPDALAAAGDESLALSEQLTYADIERIFAERIAALGDPYSIRVLGPHATEEFESGCRYCGDYHCDRVCAKVYRKGSDLWLRVTHDGRSWAAFVFLELQFRSAP